MKLRALMKLAAVCLLALSVRPAVAQDAPAAGGVGVVDMEQVMNGYVLYQSLSEEYGQMVQDLMRQLEQRQSQYPLLLEEEWNQLVALRAKEGLSPAEQNQLQALMRLSEERDRELAAIEAASPQSAEQKQRYQELMKIRTQAKQSTNEMRDRIREQMQSKDAELTEQLKAAIDAAVAKVARQLNLAVVVRKDMVLYGGRDISADLLTELNAAQTPAPAAQP